MVSDYHVLDHLSSFTQRCVGLGGIFRRTGICTQVSMEQSKGFRRKVRGETEKEERQEGRIQRDTG